MMRIIILLFVLFSAENNSAEDYDISDNVEPIIHGEPARADQAPWHVLISGKQMPTIPFGSGAFIAKDAVLTAGHVCNSVSNVSDMHVHFGGLDRKNLTFTKDIAKTHIHPNFTMKTGTADYCIIKLVEGFKGNQAKIIKISDESPAIGTEAFITGWGVNSTTSKKFEDNVPRLLQTTNLFIISHKDCQEKYKNAPLFHTITKTMICAESHSNATACHEDSGGPLVSNNTLIGILSWGNATCVISPDWPNVFSNPAVVIDWIKSVIG